MTDACFTRLVVDFGHDLLYIAAAAEMKLQNGVFRYQVMRGHFMSCHVASPLASPTSL